jgi:hypothetical protein
VLGLGSVRMLQGSGMWQGSLLRISAIVRDFEDPLSQTCPRTRPGSNIELDKDGDD